MMEWKDIFAQFGFSGILLFCSMIAGKYIIDKLVEPHFKRLVDGILAKLGIIESDVKEIKELVK